MLDADVPVGETLSVTALDANNLTQHLAEGHATGNGVRLVVQPRNETNALLYDLIGKAAFDFYCD